MQEAVAEGPNHWPGKVPQAEAPWETKLWMEKGAEESSAKRERMEGSVCGSDEVAAGVLAGCSADEAVEDDVC